MNTSEKLIGKKVIVRSDRAGVFFGTLSNYDSATKEAEIRQVRQIWSWRGAASLMQMASEGVRYQDQCRFTVTLDSVTVMDVIEILPCTDAAIKNIEEVPVWRI
jgi:hypothetical protein